MKDMIDVEGHMLPKSRVAAILGLLRVPLRGQREDPVERRLMAMSLARAPRAPRRRFSPFRDVAERAAL